MAEKPPVTSVPIQPRSASPGRADGSLPPSPRWLKDDPWRVTRQAVGLPYVERLGLEQSRRAAVVELDRIDEEVADLFIRRRAALERARVLHERLWPAVPTWWGRRPPAPDGGPMVPVVHQPMPLTGWSLRQLCLALLRRHGTLALRELHDLIHLLGFEVTGGHPVKALADALGFEHDHGRAERVERGVYRAVERTAPGPGPGPFDDDLDRPPTGPDPMLGLDPAYWFATFADRQNRTRHGHRAEDGDSGG